jgi:uncharacterized protein (DUF1015 family)
MIDIEPFAAYTYNHTVVKDINKVVAPPWDVIDEKERAELFSRSPWNIINLISKDASAEKVKGLFTHWIKEDILTREPARSFYYMKHFFRTAEDKMERKGFFAVVRLQDFSEKNIIPHERVFQKYHENRYCLIQQCKANFSPVFMLYRDKEKKIEKIIDKSNKKYSGEIKNESFDFGVIDNSGDITAIKNLLKNKKLFIADGHHRYQAALRYYKDNPSEENSYVLVFLVNIDSPHLVILPTHRYFPYPVALHEKMTEIKEFFTVEKTPDTESMFALMYENEKQHSFGVYDGKDFLVLTLKDEDRIIRYLPGGHSARWQKLDSVILHEFLLDRLLKVGEGEFLFSPSADYLMDEYKNKKEGVIFFLNPTRKDQFINICSNGEVMPQKSTYFYPKVPSGLLIHKFK